jgi:hypothetical protein
VPVKKGIFPNQDDQRGTSTNGFKGRSECLSIKKKVEATGAD